MYWATFSPAHLVALYPTLLGAAIRKILLSNFNGFES
jgi:hypothetical protein